MSMRIFSRKSKEKSQNEDDSVSNFDMNKSSDDELLRNSTPTKEDLPSSYTSDVTSSENKNDQRTNRVNEKKVSNQNGHYEDIIDNMDKQKSHNGRVPIFALAFFLGVFIFSITFVLLAFFGARDISIFGFVLLPHDIYYNFLNGLFTTTEITDFWANNPLAFFGLIAIFLTIVGVIVKFLSAFREPISEFDSEQSDGSVTYFNFTKLFSRVRFIFIKATDDQNMDTVKDFVGTIFNYKTDSKNTNAVYCVPDKRNKKSDNENFFLEFPECFDISTLRNHMSEHSWITLATNLAMSITMTILIVGTLLNIALNIITQSELNPYMIFGVTSWISLAAVISISVVMVWALKEIKGSYGVFRIIKVTKTPLDVDRYIVIPYYHDGISGNDIDNVMKTYLSYNKQTRLNSNLSSTSNLPAIFSDEMTQNCNNTDLSDNILDSDTVYVPDIEFDEGDIEFDLNKAHTTEFYTSEIEQLKNKTKTLEMERDRALLMVNQLADDNTSLKKAIRARKSIDYSNIRSMTSLQDRPAQQQPTKIIENLPSNSAKKDGNSYLIPIIIIAILGAIVVWWASINFDPTQFLIIVVVGLLLVVVIVAVVGLLVLRQYLNESSQGKRINFG